MIQSIVEGILNRLIGEYIENLDSKQLNVSLYNGVVDLCNLRLKKDLCQRFDIPLQLIFGKIGKLHVKVPWNALSSRPVQIEIEGIQVLAVPVVESSWRQIIENQNKPELLQERLLSIAQAKMREAILKHEAKVHEEKADESKSGGGFFSNLMTKVIDNLQIKIKGIHVRLEDTHFFSQPISMGVTLERLFVESKNERGDADFIDRTLEKNKAKPIRKHIDMRNFGVYCEPKDKAERLISLRNGSQEESKHRELADSQEQFFNNMFKMSGPQSTMAIGYEQAYIIKPISLVAKLTQLSPHHDFEKDPAKARFEIDIGVNAFDISFRKSQLQTVFRFVANTKRFQVAVDAYQAEKRQQLVVAKDRELYAEAKEQFKTRLLAFIIRDVLIIAHEGQKVTKEQLNKFDAEAGVHDKKGKDVFDTFLKYESWFVLEQAVHEVLHANETQLVERHRRAKYGEDQSSGGVVSYLGSWLGWGGSATSIETKTEGEDEDDYEQFYDALATNTDEIYGDFNEPIEPVAEDEDPVAIVLATFHLAQFRVSMVDDSKVFELAQRPDQAHTFERSEVALQTRGLTASFASYPATPHAGAKQAILVGIGQLKIDYIQQLAKQDLTIIKNTHQLLWGQQPPEQAAIKTTQNGESDLVHLEWHSQRNEEGRNRQILDVQIDRVHLTYRKEFVEFFMTFFSSEPSADRDVLEAADEVNLRMIEDYERLRESVNMQRVMEAAAANDEQGNGDTIELKIVLSSLIGFVPVYGLHDAKQVKERLGFGLNYLIDIHDKPAWVVILQQVYFHNQQSAGYRIFEDRGGQTGLFFSVQPELFFAEDLRDYWKCQDLQANQKLFPTLSNCRLDVAIRSKNGSYKFQDTRSVPDFSMEFRVENGCIRINPVVYCYLFNIANCFFRPTAESGDVAQLQVSEQRHIFRNVKAMAMCRKRANHLKVWYRYIAVVSGSYLYFYPINKKTLSLFNRLNVMSSNKWGRLAITVDVNEELDLSGVCYEEYFLLKGCHSAQPFNNKAKNLWKQGGKQSKTNSSLHFVNSSRQEAILEFDNEGDMKEIQTLVISRADEIRSFLAKTSFAFGTYKEIKVEDGKQLDENMKQKLIDVQLDQKNNFDDLVTGDIEQKLQEYEFVIKQVAIIFQGTDDFLLTKEGGLVKPGTPDKIVLSPVPPSQLNEPTDSTKTGSDVKGRFEFLVEARDFAMSFSTRWFDQAMTISIGSLRGIDRTPHLALLDEIRAGPERAKALSFCAEVDDLDRYQTFLQSGSTFEEDNIIKIVLMMQDLRSPRYESTEIDFSIALSQLVINWQPLVLNRLIRFVRYMTYPDEMVNKIKLQVMQTLKLHLQRKNAEGKHDDEALAQIEETLDIHEHSELGSQHGAADEGEDNDLIALDKVQSRTTCQEDTTISMNVHVFIKKFKLVCMHPQNRTYPVFTKKADQFSFTYSMLADHDVYELKLANLRLLDNTKYPNTLSVTKTYGKDAKKHSQHLMGFLEPSQDGENMPFVFKMSNYHYPRDFCCPLQTSRQYSALVEMKIRSLKLDYRQEYVFRVNDYFMYQFLYSLTDSNPYEDIRRRIEEKIDPLSQNGNLRDSKSGASITSSVLDFHKTVLVTDMDWEKQATGLDIVIENPLIILKDRPYLPESFRLDLGKIRITNTTEEKFGRWLKEQDRPVNTTNYKIVAEAIRVDHLQLTNQRTDTPVCFVTGDGEEYWLAAREVIKPFNLGLDYEMVNSSPYLQDYFLSANVDFHDLMIEDRLIMQSCGAFVPHINDDEADSSVRMSFSRETYTYMMRCIDLSINYVDSFDKHFQFSAWSSENTLKWINIQNQMTQKFKGTTVRKRSLTFNINDGLRFSCLMRYGQQYSKRASTKQSVVSLKRDINVAEEDEDLANSEEMLAELVLTRFCMTFEQFVDTRNKVVIRAADFYVLYKEREDSQHFPLSIDEMRDPNFKSLVLGPIGAPRNLKITKDYFKASEQRYHKGDTLYLTCTMNADSSKKIDLDLSQLKLFLRLDLLYLINDYFYQGLPTYEVDCRDKPAGFDADPGNVPRLEFNVSLRHSLVVFEQLSRRRLRIYQILKGSHEKSDRVRQSAYVRHPVEVKRDKRAAKKQKASTHNNENEDINNYFTKTVAFKGDVRVGYVREKQNETKFSLLQRYATRYAQSLLEDSDEEETEMTPEEKAEKTAVQGKTREFELPHSAYTIQIVDFQPFLCDIKEISQDFRDKEKRRRLTADQILRKISSRLLIANPLNFTYNSQTILGVAGSSPGIQKFKKLVAQEVEANTQLLTEEVVTSFVKKASNFKTADKKSVKVDLANLQVTFNDLTVIRGVVKKFEQLTQDYEYQLKRMSFFRAVEIAAPTQAVCDTDKLKDEDDPEQLVAGQERPTHNDLYIDYDSEDLDSDELNLDGLPESLADSSAHTFSDDEADFMLDEKSEKLYQSGERLVEVNNNTSQKNISQRSGVAVPIDEQCDFEDSDDQIETKSVMTTQDRRHKAKKPVARAVLARPQQRVNQQTKRVYKMKLQSQLMELTSYRETTNKKDEDKAGQDVVLAVGPASSTRRKKIPRRFKVRRLRFDINQQTGREQDGTSDDSVEYGPVEQRGADEIEVLSRGFKLIIINDRDSNFLPIVSLNGSPCRLIRQLDQQIQSMHAKLTLSMNFFNVNIGRWEPALEVFQLQMVEVIDYSNRQSSQSMVFESPLKINFTEKLVENIYESHRSWQGASEDYSTFEKFCNVYLEKFRKQQEQLDKAAVACDSSDEDEATIALKNQFDLGDSDPEESENERIRRVEKREVDLDIELANALALERAGSAALSDLAPTVVDRALQRTLGRKDSDQPQDPSSNQALQDQMNSATLLLRTGVQKLYTSGANFGKKQDKDDEDNVVQEIITPYVILNKIDVGIQVFRLQKKKKPTQAVGVNQDDSQILDSQQSSSGNNGGTGQLSTPVHQSSTRMQNIYKIKSGHIVDYMVDYNEEERQLIFDERIQRHNEINEVESEEGSKPVDCRALLRDGIGGFGDHIHTDSIGEYKSEYVRIFFDHKTADYFPDTDRQQSDDYFTIKQVNLNELGYQSHILRAATQTLPEERIYYGCRLLNGKKLFTIRSQHQIVNFTSNDYLIALAAGGRVVLVKYLESGDSISLSRRFDECKLQIKLIDEEKTEGEDVAAKVEHMKKKWGAVFDETLGRYVYPEESLYKKKEVKNFKEMTPSFENWSSQIPVRVLKEKLRFKDNSYLKNATSKYTFIRKTRSDILSNETVSDINLMPPMIIKNCLPMRITFHFKDSSDVQQTIKLDKAQEQNLFCFAMNETISCDIELPDFKVIKGWKLFNLQKVKVRRARIPITDHYGCSTEIYARMQSEGSGLRVVFYCKKLLIDSIDSPVRYFFQRPSMFGNKIEEVLSASIPYVNLGMARQKVYILPDRAETQGNQSENQQQFVFATLDGQYKRSDCVKIDTTTVSVAMEFTLKGRDSKQFGKFSYKSTNYLAMPGDILYTKVTTVTPYYILVNQSPYSLVFEQIGLSSQEIKGGDQGQVSLILSPGQREPFNFQSDIGGSRADELVHLRVADEEVPCGGFTVQKSYMWSCPYQISTLQTFTVKSEPQLSQRKLQMIRDKIPNPKEQLKMLEKLQEPKYIRVSCRSDPGADGSESLRGSIFVIIREEPAELASYVLRNESKLVAMTFKQQLNVAAKQAASVDAKRIENREQLIQSTSTRYSWASVLHEGLLRVGFANLQPQLTSYAGPIGGELERLQLIDLNKSQQQRVVKVKGGPTTELLVQLDKIGHKDDIFVRIGQQRHQLRLTVETDGLSRILVLKDLESVVEFEIKQNNAEGPVPALTEQEKDRMRTLLTDKEIQEGLNQKFVQMHINQIVLSIIHMKRELLTVFCSDIGAKAEEERGGNTHLQFEIGYLQIDNQAQAEPGYAAIIRPRDLIYDQGKVRLILDEAAVSEIDAPIHEDSIKCFQWQVELNNMASSQKNKVLYVESIAFLLQTLTINIQFSHFIKMATFFLSLQKIMNSSVSQVHYVLESDDRFMLIEAFKKQNEVKELASTDLDYVKQATSGRFQSVVVTKNEIDAQSELLASEYVRGKTATRTKGRGELITHEDVELDVFIDYREQARRKRKERLNNFAKQDVLMASQLIGKTRRGQKIAENTQVIARKLDADFLSTTEANWQLTSLLTLQDNDVQTDRRRRIFIAHYQSSPLELIVCATSANLQNEKKMFEASTKQTDGMQEIDETKDENGSEELISIMSASDEQMARNVLYFSTFEDMPFQMNALNIQNIFGEDKDVMSQLMTHHKETFKYNMFRLLGSSNMIGNPTKFFSGLGTGVSDFFVKPYQGLRDGSMSKTADGMAAGSKSLLKALVTAPSGAMSKLGNSLSKGVAALSFDDKFIQEKNEYERLNKPQNIGDGLVKGVQSAGTSIWSGFTGVFTKPVEGFQEKGVGGLLVGTGKGVAGLFTKTVSGAVDVIGKPLQGLEQQTSSSAASLLAQLKMREARLFYENVNLLKNYRSLDANWLAILPKLYQSLDLRHIYEMTCIPELFYRVILKSGQKMYCVRANLLILTKNHLVHMLITSMHPREEFANILKPLDERNKPRRGRPATELSEQVELAALAPSFYRVLANPSDVKVDESDSNVINFSAGVSATKVKIVGAYFVRQAEYFDIINDRQLLLVFRTDQSKIVRRRQYMPGENGKLAGAAAAESPHDFDPTVAQQVEMYGSLNQTRISQAEVQSTRQKMLGKFTNQGPHDAEKRAEENRHSRVHAGKYHLHINFIDPNQGALKLNRHSVDEMTLGEIDFGALSDSTSVKMQLLKIRAQIKKEREREQRQQEHIEHQ